jgi:hypothetical protein
MKDTLLEIPITPVLDFIYEFLADLHVIALTTTQTPRNRVETKVSIR